MMTDPTWAMVYLNVIIMGTYTLCSRWILHHHHVEGAPRRFFSREKFGVREIAVLQRQKCVVSWPRPLTVTTSGVARDALLARPMCCATPVLTARSAPLENVGHSGPTKHSLYTLKRTRDITRHTTHRLTAARTPTLTRRF